MEAMATVHMSEAEVARDLHAVLAKVQQGDEDRAGSPAHRRAEIFRVRTARPGLTVLTPQVLTCDANTVRTQSPGNRMSGWAYEQGGGLASDGRSTLRYNLENQLAKSVPLAAGSAETKYSYDGDGRRVMVRTGVASPVVYVYDAMGGLAAEYNGTSALSGVHYVHTDHLGSTRLLADANGAAVRRADYWPFGGEILGVETSFRTSGLAYTGDSEPKVKFTGKERDAETGLDYFGARYFASVQGRWTIPDWSQQPMPIPYADLSDPRTLNLYAYVRNNPLSLIDPDGHSDSMTRCHVTKCMANSKGPSKAELVAWGVVGTAAIDAVAIPEAAAVGAGMWIRNAAVASWLWLGTPGGQKTMETAVEILGPPNPGPSFTVTGNLARLSKAELATGKRLAAALGENVNVSSHVGEEFVSQSGRAYDAMGAPGAYLNWNPNKFFASSDSHVLKSGVTTVIELAGASKSQVTQIKNYVSSLSKEIQDRITYVGI